MQLTINGIKLPQPLIAETIATTLRKIPQRKRVRMVCQNDGRTLLARRQLDKGFRLVWHDNFGTIRYGERADLELASVIAVFTFLC